MKYFYGHIIDIEGLIVRLEDLELTPTQRQHLAGLVDQTLHSTILDAILAELKDSDKELFVKELRDGDHQAVWDFFDRRILRVEERIKQVADDLVRELHNDIEEVKIK